MASRPQNIGIKAIEIYFPSQYVEQSELEKFDGVSAGKYTIGLGQTKMSFCDDREDIYSFSLTVVSKLLKNYNVDTNSIGRLEVGTETILDKSKSVKSVLMQLFGDNTNIEGVDTVNACYGGTNAVFNTVNWIESSGWDGRDGIVVAGDIALYAKGNARPTGGAGAVALLIGPDAPIVIEPGLRGSYMQHAYDFYKPDLTSEYPYVDGHYSVNCYTKALDSAYRAYCKREAFLSKAATNGHTNGSAVESGLPKTPLDRFDYLAFHAPTCKLVAKSYARLLYHDYLADPESPAFADVPPEVRDMDYEKSLTDKVVEKTFMTLTKKRFQERVNPSIQVATMCGNMYCASVWGGLASLVSHVDPANLLGKRIGLFSYGSGLAASFCSFRVVGSTEQISKVLDIPNRLVASRRAVPPEAYDAMCDLRKKAHLQKDYKPEGEVSTILPGTYYLENIDDMFKRFYSVKA
ncbi:hydroxymethylglutaryl-coenzyme A synthase C terminal-domain-containing protein [Apodospora peruviana]|uniref:Hydroxymethylglutaryl-CoA synthase n=1 Tax=Apodospora peruviana TaxID=516989 RepID=A0AAE0M317_9PEZI|nr:hydroxymethylglutaryl-coenzyme A synthase C terminal-domain-containing protein [Apodospora peruviana]